MTNILQGGESVKSTLDLALDYLVAHPNRFIFPVKRLSKSPPLVSDNLRKASDDPEQIRRWHKKYPGCNWALALAMSGLICADVDTRAGKNGAETFTLLDLLWGWPATETTRTPSGGLHHLYRGEHVFAIGERGFGTDLDSPNYIIIPGCKTADGEYVALDSIACADAPDWFYQILATRSAPAQSQEPAVDWDLPENVEWAIDYLSNDAPPSIEGRSGEKTTFDVAGVLKDHGISEHTALELMAAHYNVAGKCKPLWQMGDCAVQDSLPVKVHNAYTYKTAVQPGAATAAAEFADDPPPELTADDVPTLPEGYVILDGKIIQQVRTPRPRRGKKKGAAGASPKEGE